MNVSITARRKRRQGLGTELDDHRWGPVLKQRRSPHAIHFAFPVSVILYNYFLHPKSLA